MGCDIEKKNTIEDLEFTNLGIEIFPNICGYLADIGISVNGGTAPYSYFLDDKLKRSSFITNLIIGEYEVKVIDANGCRIAENIVVSGESQLSYKITRCRSAGPKGPGYIVISAIGGTAPYRYQLGPGYNTKGRFINLEETEYELTITDAYGCILTDNVTLCPSQFMEMKSEQREEERELVALSVYPNPEISVLNIEYKSNKEELIYIYDIQGNMILFQKIAPYVDIHKIEISTLPAGIYNLKMEDHHKNYRFIKIE